MRGLAGIDPGWGVTAVRLAMGVIFATAGWAKFANGIGGVVAAFTKYGIPWPSVSAPCIATLELVGGIALVLGVASRWFGLLFTCEFIVAAFYVKLPGTGWAASRLDVMLLAGAILMLLAAPGRLALDELWLERPLAERTA